MTLPPTDDSSAGSPLRTHARPQTNRAGRLLAIADLARRQDRVVSRRQLQECGWTNAQIDHEIAYGRWHLAAPGVVALQNAELTHAQRLWLGVLHAGPHGVLTHLTAVRRAGLRWTSDDLIDVLTPKGHLVEPMDGFFFHQTRRSYRRWLRPVTEGPPRLPLEYAALLAAERDQRIRRAIGLLAACVQQGLTSADALILAKGQIRKLRHGREFELALGDIAGGAQSFAEIDVGLLCEGAGLMPPTRQATRVDRDGRRRYLDCEWVLPDGRVIVLEIDGSFHLQVDQWWKDMKRERSIVLSASTVLRCSSVEVRLEPQAIVADLFRAGVPEISPFVWAS